MPKFLTRALTAAIVASCVLTTAALADTVIIENDVLLNSNVTKVAGTTGTAYVRVEVTNGTPSGDVNGCNVTGANPLTVNLVSSNSKVTLTDSSVAVAGCDVESAFTYAIAADATGTAVISTSSVSGGKTDGTRLYATSDTLVITITAGASCTAPSEPTINATGGTAGDNGWYTAAPTLSSTPSTGVEWATAINGGAKSAFSSTIPTLGVGTTVVYARAISGTCQSTEASATFKVDPNAPSISAGSATGTSGTNGWYTSAVSQSFTATDGTNESGFDASFVNPFSVSSGTYEGSDVYIPSGAVSDVAGNTNPGINAGPFKIDLGDPYNVAFSSTLSGTYYWDFVPAEPTCTADDDISGLKDCIVSGYGTEIGSHTLTATATDNAGRTATTTASYTVAAWTLRGFYQPVDMDGVWNTVKAGSTVPFKFNVFAGPTELKTTGYVQAFSSTGIACPKNGYTADSIEVTATGTTSLRYDENAGQFVYNWQTPKSKAGSCYRITMTTRDGSALEANFILK